MEQWLLLNDFAALGLETEVLRFPPPEKVTIVNEYMTKPPTKGEQFTNTMLVFYYTTPSIVARLEAADSMETLSDPLEIARFCAAACILERCYTHRAKSHNTDEALPLFLYRQVMSYVRVITRG